MASRRIKSALAIGTRNGPSIPGVSSNLQPGLGKQLSRRIASAALSQDQAEKVAGQRALFRRAYGPDWRTQVYGDRGYVERVRSNLAAGKNSVQNEALYTQLMKLRQGALSRAKAKLAR